MHKSCADWASQADKRLKTQALSHLSGYADWILQPEGEESLNGQEIVLVRSIKPSHRAFAPIPLRSAQTLTDHLLVHEDFWSIATGETLGVLSFNVLLWCLVAESAWPAFLCKAKSFASSFPKQQKKKHTLAGVRYNQILTNTISSLSLHVPLPLMVLLVKQKFPRTTLLFLLGGFSFCRGQHF